MTKKQMNKSILTMCLLLPLSLMGQKYITAAGIRMSNEGAGLSIQQRVLEHTTVEAIGMINLNEATFSGLLEYHNNLLFSKSLNTYIGAGPVYGKYYNADSAYLGADVILGLEYKILLMPMVISLDLKPRMKLEQDDWFNLGTAITIRYVFIKEKRKLFNRD
jgi:hypothetical protein